MNKRGDWGVVAVVLLVAACASERTDAGPHGELAGDVGGGGFGGAPVITIASGANSGGASGVVVSSAAAGGAGGGGVACADGVLEPNGSEMLAPLVASINDCDSNELILSAVLAGADDVDWFRYKGNDVFGCQVDPSRELTASGPVMLCKYAECEQGEPATVVCEDESVSSISFEGRPGCCHDAGFGMDVDCDGSDDDATIYLQLTQTADACTSYTLDFHY